MKIACISDTHGFHNQIIFTENVDCIIHAGDSTNYKDIINNQIEFNSFIDWYSKLDIKHKILIAGNYDAWATKKYNIDKVKDLGIIYLEHEYCEIDNITFFGSPYTPTFGDWYFMKDRAKLDKYWNINIKCDILITHGPPKGILDLSYDNRNNLIFCGDNALRKNIRKIPPSYHIFGHIHNNKDIVNYGVRIIDKTVFVNASMVKDREFDKGVINEPIYINF